MLPGWRRAFRLPESARQAERDLDDEIAFHIAMKEERLLATGLSPDEARRRARERFGDVGAVRRDALREDRPRVARLRLGAMAGDLARDMAGALRTLRRAPGFTATTVLTLALGIGATTAIFSVAYGVLLRPLPFAEPDRLVQLVTANPASAMSDVYVSEPEYADVARQIPSLATAAAIQESRLVLADDGRPEQVVVGRATASLFPLLGVQALHGRVYGTAEDEPGADGVIVLGRELWQRRYGGDPAVVGRTVRLDGRARTVVGVLPGEARVRELEAFVPLALDPAEPRSRGAHYLQVLARLRAGATLDGLRAELATYSRRLHVDHPESYGDRGFAIAAVSLRDAWTGDARPMLLALLAAVGLLLLLACVNVANLLLVRAEARQREIGIRVALGAGRGRIVRQMLAETLLLAAAGAAVGLPLATLGVRALLALNPAVVPPGTHAGMDATVLGVAVAVVVATAVVAGLVPALQAAAFDVRGAIGAGSAGGGRRGERLRSGLVVVELAVAAIVLVGAGLVGRSLWTLLRVDPGFEAAPALVFDLRLPPNRPETAPEVPATFATLLDRLRALPGVEGAAATSHLPMGGGTGDWTVEVEGRPAGPGGLPYSPDYRVVSAGYHDAMGIPLRAGRPFAATDRADGVPVVIVSERLAGRLWPGESPLGRRIRLGGPPDMQIPWMEVVGVAGDVRHAGLDAEPRGTYYMLDRQFPAMVGGATRSMAIVVRTGGGDPAALAPAVRRVVGEFDRELAVANLRPLAAVVGSTAARPRFAAVVLAAFGGASLLLAVVGVYGVLAYVVTRRRRELSVRIALGACSGAVRGLIVGSGLRLAAIGVAAGLLASLAGTRLLAALLYEVSAVDTATFAATAVVLLAAAALASLVPARRATRVSPAEVLRGE